MRQLPCQPIQDLMKCISCFSWLREQHRLFHRRVCEEPLLLQDHFGRYGCEDGVQVGDVFLVHKHAYVFPWNGVGERQNDVVCYDHGDAAKHHAFHQPGTPRSPPQRAQAEDGTLHVFVIEISCTALLMTLGDLKGNGKPFGVRSQQECPRRNNDAGNLSEAQAGIEGEKRRITYKSKNEGREINAYACS
nr:Os01g0926450 [Ipomoea batatas]